jgi:hypothetical protein
MPKKTTSSDDLLTTIARGVGSAVGRIAITAQRLTTASTEAIKGIQPKKAKRAKPRTSAKKKAVKKVVAKKSKTTAKKKNSRAKS